MQDISMISNIGGREHNQDYALFRQKNDKFCLAVGDGLGSYNGSDIASKVAVETIVNWFDENCDNNDLLTKTAVQDAVLSAHEKVREAKQFDSSISSSCTTIAVVLSDGETSVMAHVGDTRIYLVRNGKIVYRSKDHSLAQLAVDRGEITVEEIPTHSDQNKLLRVVGSDYYIGPEVVILQEKLEKGDGFLVCSDGIWEYTKDAEIAQTFETENSATSALRTIVNLHTMRAPSTCDNYTAIVAKQGE